MRKAKEDLSGFDNSAHSKLELIGIVCEVIDNGFGLDLILSSNSFTERRKKQRTRALDAYSAKLKRFFKAYIWFNRFNNAREMEASLDSDFQIDASLLTIMTIVKSKFSNVQAQNAGITLPQMLTLVLYTGCEMNYALSAAMRNDNGSFEDVMKWSITISVLSDAIVKLHTREPINQKIKSQCQLYTGIPKVIFPPDKFDEDGFVRGVFSAFTSTSREMHVAEQFCGDQGGLIMTITHRMVCRIVSC